MIQTKMILLLAGSFLFVRKNVKIFNKMRYIHN